MSIKDKIADSPTFKHGFTRSYERLQGENLIHAVWATRSSTWRMELGVLYLTDRRLLFSPSLFTAGWLSTKLNLGEVVEIGGNRVPWHIRLRAVLGMSSWYVSAAGERYYFITTRRERAELLDKISSLTGLSPE